MKTIAVIGLGYVGLPLAIEFGKYRQTIGFDVNESRITSLKYGQDINLDVSVEHLKAATHLQLTSCIKDLRQAQIFIVAVPTPIDQHKRPDMHPLIQASAMIGSVLKENDIVIYESTVYPGVTEDVCAQVLEEVSGLQYNRKFFCGYSPERINPGDKVHTLTNIRKITSGSTIETAREVDQLYQEIIKAGTYMAPSIKVAEAAKVTENTQRDINIAFMNELACIFNLMGIDTGEVIQAARTKWNFLPFEPGLVGGHCIAVDPYYLICRAQELNYNPELLLAARRVNENMVNYIVAQVIKSMIKKEINVSGAKVLVLGITFKPYCADLRNSKAIEIVHELQEFGCKVDVIDPWALPKQVYKESSIVLKSANDLSIVNGVTIVDGWDVVIIAVAHPEFQKYNFSSMKTANKFIYDITGTLPKITVDERL